MGREVRRVRGDWQHPKDSDGNFKPLFSGEDYEAQKSGWLLGLAERGLQGVLDYRGNPPNREDFMPYWPEAERTHLMMYETCTEGTPISPAFETPEALAKWLADTNASAFGDSGASYEGWLRVAQGGYAPTAAMIGGVMLSGVDALTD